MSALKTMLKTPEEPIQNAIVSYSGLLFDTLGPRVRQHTEEAFGFLRCMANVCEADDTVNRTRLIGSLYTLKAIALLLSESGYAILQDNMKMELNTGGITGLHKAITVREEAHIKEMGRRMESWIATVDELANAPREEGNKLDRYELLGLTLASKLRTLRDLDPVASEEWILKAEEFMINYRDVFMNCRPSHQFLLSTSMHNA
ncbi:unnamed protein product [Heligmosomoides polygyrus]|uniref:C6 transcription factor n=1 Tax=Heligmosomoides polygyrus TaxID=6339 RepID=A0A183GEN2_HELPZ|nr:unnamed protein product [Heligmosomoides polygyrus]